MLIEYDVGVTEITTVGVAKVKRYGINRLRGSYEVNTLRQYTLRGSLCES